MLSELAASAVLAFGTQTAVAADPPGVGPGPDAPAAAVYNGFDGQTDIVAPRFDDPGIAIDGRLDDPAWSEAAVLTGFSQYDPSEGFRPRRTPRCCS